MIAYTLNDDNSINILGGSNSIDTLHKILPNIEFEVFDGEPYEFNGKHYLSTDDISEEERKEVEKRDKIQQLDVEYQRNYEELQKYFLQAVMNNDREVMEEIQQELQDLKDEYDVEFININKLS